VTGVQSQLYRTEYFSFAFYKDARGECSCDGNQFTIEPGLIIFNNPGHVKQYRLDYVKELCHMTLSESFLKENVHNQIFDEFPFLVSELVPPKVVSPPEYAEFEELYLQIEKAYQSGSRYKYKLIGHLFVALLIRIKEKFWVDYNPIREGDRGSEIVRKFKMLLEKHYRDLSKGLIERPYRASDYAQLLNLHPNYLNTVLKVKTGKCVVDWIAEKTIAEAKALLKRPEISVKEIAYLLGFAETQHFSTYFKKHTSLSPVLYRQGS
jgi:AraC-like DNA-binding protein